MSALDPSICNASFGAILAGWASNVVNPLEPYPGLFGATDCGRGSDGSGDVNFPDTNKPIDCQASANCLRVITDFNSEFNPLVGEAIPAKFVNTLPSETRGVTSSNIFSKSTDRLYSWFCPPQYIMVFYTADPTKQRREQAAAGGYLLVPPNTVQPNACAAMQPLTNGGTFFTYSGSENPAQCVAAWCGCGRSSTPQVDDFCKSPIPYRTCPALQHNAPWFVVVKRLEFTQMLRSMCVDNAQFYLGGIENSMNRIWSPQSPACDLFITNQCHSRNPADAKLGELCACFAQQQALDQTYGKALQVSVCCFGQDPTNDVAKACFFNSKAYKTSNMLKHCCSFAQCQQIITETPAGETMKAMTPTPGKIKCAGDFVVFPPVATPTPTVTVAPSLPYIVKTTTSVIPSYVWILLGLGVGFLFLFILLLAFV